MKTVKTVAIAAILTILCVNTANSQGLGSLLGGGLGDTLGNLIEGVFTSSDITVADLEGEWTSDGPAVCFQGEGFLKKAGGAAAAAAIESKLQPYYDQYGFTGAKLEVDSAGNFTLTCKSIKLKGNITPKEGAEKGVFDFNFTVFNKKIAGVTGYVEKTSKTMDVMFDATKLKTLVSAITQFSGSKLLSGISSILDSYDGLCVGFHFSGGKTTQENSGFNLLNILGGGSNGSSSTTGNDSSNTTGNDTTGTGGGVISTGLDLLKGVLTKGKK